jgi:hypothetical protein
MNVSLDLYSFDDLIANVTGRNFRSQSISNLNSLTEEEKARLWQYAEETETNTIDDLDELLYSLWADGVDKLLNIPYRP